ncbi:MAG: acyl-CoA thioesterase/BAAT N-terminal domain-containing protein [Pseudonocardia sp.]
MLGFLPWILYWALVGNVPFRVVVCLALAVAVGTQVVSRLRRQPWRSLEVGSLAVFVVLAVAGFVFDDAFLEKWLQPLSNLGIFLVALVGILVGRPFVREYAADSVDEATTRGDGFRTITTAMTWLWVVIFGAMTVLSAIPPVVDGDATIHDDGTLLSILCYWVLPFSLMGLGGLVSGLFPPWFEKGTARIDRREIDETPTVAPQPVAPADSATGGLVLDLPADSRHDEPFALTVRGAPAGARVEVSTTGCDLFGREWRSTASFTAPETGSVDASVLAPAAGDWTRPDPDAPLWAMRFAADGVTPEVFVPPAQPWQITVTARVDGAGRARRTVRRHAAADGVRCSPVQIDGRPGLLALPAGAAPPGGWPAVACFGGSEGGNESQVGHATLLASRGFAALAAGWIPENAPIASVPLERFTAAVQHLADHSEVDADRVAAMAVSRGSEGLLAAVCSGSGPACRGLVLVSPSSVTWQAIGGDGEVPDTPSWTLRGRPVPWVPMPSGALMPQLVRNAWRIGRDTAAHRPTLLRLRPAYQAGLDATPSPAGAVIAAERAGCPLLLLTGTDDEIWPSGPMADALLARRDRVDDRHLSYPGAGHLIRLGVLPTDAQWTGGIAMGGTREDQAAAQRDATTRVPEFLRSVTAARAPAVPHPASTV